MTSVSHSCPYCGSKGAAFQLLNEVASQLDSHHWYSLARCGVCKEIALIKLEDGDTRVGRANAISPLTYSREKRLEPRFSIAAFFPRMLNPTAPENVPENVASAFIEAEASFNNGHYSAAGSCYRKAIERAVKVSFPEGKGMLNQRIRELENQGSLPKTLIALADQVKLLGNLAMHEAEDDPTKEDCIAAREFSVLFLTYMFTLPVKIENAKLSLGKQVAVGGLPTHS